MFLHLFEVVDECGLEVGQSGASAKVERKTFGSMLEGVSDLGKLCLNKAPDFGQRDAAFVFGQKVEIGLETVKDHTDTFLAQCVAVGTLDPGEPRVGAAKAKDDKLGLCKSS